MVRLRSGKRLAARWSSLDALESRLLLVFDPTAQEQYMLELLNHLRMQPAENLDLMTSSLGAQARSNDADTDSALRFFKTSGTVLAEQWASLTAVPPVAWNEDLYEAAEFHSQQMILADEQTHQAAGEPDLGQRARNAGYTNFTTLGENVYAFARSIFHGHTGFALDWGDTPTGIQSPPGHRNSMMNASFREVGIRVLGESVSSTSVGPLVITQDFGARFSSAGAFLLGVVTSDSDGDRNYDVGEGLGGVSVRLVGTTGTFTSISFSAGGYQVQAPPGIYDVTFSGGAFGSETTYRNISLGSQNIKLDAIRGVAPPAPEIAVFGLTTATSVGVAIAAADTTPATTDGTDFGRVNIATTLTRLFTVQNSGRANLQLSGSPRVRITGAGASAFAVVDDADGLIEPGGRTTFAIRYEPSGVENVVATVTILSDDSDEPIYSFRIRARGIVAPSIDVTGSAGVVQQTIADGDATPAWSDGTGFSTVNVKSQKRLRTFVIRNTGSANLEFESVNGSLVTITGAHARDFVVILQPASVIAPGQSTSFRVRFDPLAAGVRNAAVQIESNVSGMSGSYQFSLRGQGVLAPIVEVRGNGVVVPASGDPSEVNGTQFGTAIAGSGIVDRIFTLRNNGSANLVLKPVKRNRITIDAGGNGGGIDTFRIASQPSVQTLRPGQSTTFRVRFIPGTVGTYQVRVMINTNNAGAAAFEVSGVAV